MENLKIQHEDDIREYKALLAKAEPSLVAASVEMVSARLDQDPLFNKQLENLALQELKLPATIPTVVELTELKTQIANARSEKNLLSQRLEPLEAALREREQHAKQGSIIARFLIFGCCKKAPELNSPMSSYVSSEHQLTH